MGCSGGRWRDRQRAVAKQGLPVSGKPLLRKELLLFSLTHFFYLGLCSPWAWGATEGLGLGAKSTGGSLVSFAPRPAPVSTGTTRVGFRGLVLGLGAKASAVIVYYWSHLTRLVGQARGSGNLYSSVLLCNTIYRTAAGSQALCWGSTGGGFPQISVLSVAYLFYF